MIKDTKIPQAARNFVDRFGKDAPVEARQRANELQQAGNAEGHDTWMQIYEQVKRLVDDGIDAPRDDGGMPAEESGGRCLGARGRRRRPDRNRKRDRNPRCGRGLIQIKAASCRRAYKTQCKRMTSVQEIER